MTASSKTTLKPKLGCEVLADRIVAGRCDEARTVLEVCAARTLPPGSIVPNLANPNLPHAEALQSAVADALSMVGGRSKDIIVVIPDAAVRVLLLDFDTLPEKQQDAEGVVRFRLKKSLPFDSDKALLSFQAQRSNGSVKVIAAVAMPSVVEEYESVFRAAGYNPGVVVPSMLAALASADDSRPSLIVKVDPTTISVALVDHDDLILFRTVENVKGPAVDADLLAEEIYPSLVFFQDTYGSRVEQIMVAGVADFHHLLPELAEQTEARVTELVSPGRIGQIMGATTPPSMLAGLVGALIS